MPVSAGIEPTTAIDQDGRPTLPAPLPWPALEAMRLGEGADPYESGERITLPSPIPPRPEGFDTQDEAFFGASNAPPALDLSALDDVDAWWSEQRRRALAAYVVAILAASVVLLAASWPGVR